MRIRKLSLLTAAAAGLLAAGALAQPPEQGAPPRDPEMRQKLLEVFDTNNDGTIDRPERQAIRRAMQEFFAAGPEGRGPDGRGPEGRRRMEGRGPEGRRLEGGPEGRGPADRGPEGRRGPGGPDGPPRPERLFNRFDENGDGQLSLEEFKALSEFMRERFPMGPPRGEFGRRGPRGPEGRRPRRDAPPPAEGPAPDEAPVDDAI